MKKSFLYLLVFTLIIQSFAAFGASADDGYDDLIHNSDGSFKNGFSVWWADSTGADITHPSGGDVKLAVDGNDSTEVYSLLQRSKPYIELDLGNAKEIKKITYYPNQFGGNEDSIWQRMNFTIKVSNTKDFKISETVYSQGSAVLPIGEKAIADLSGSEKFRYVRIETIYDCITAAEIGVYGSDEVCSQSILYDSGNGVSVYSDPEGESYGWKIDKLTDNDVNTNYATKFTTNQDPPRVYVDLGKMYNLTKISLLPFYDTNQDTTWCRIGLQISGANKRDFSDEVVLGNCGGTIQNPKLSEGEWYTIDLSSQKPLYRFLKITTTMANAMLLKELNVEGYYDWSIPVTTENLYSSISIGSGVKKLTNITNPIQKDSTYVDDCITVYFTDNTDMSTISNKTLILTNGRGNVINYTMTADNENHAVKIPVCELSSRMDYSLKVSNDIKSVDNVSATEEILTFSASEIAKAPYSRSSTFKNSALNAKTVFSDGTEVTGYTNGILRGNEASTKLPQYTYDNPMYAVIDLGEAKNIVSVSADGSEHTSAWWHYSNLEFYGTNNIYYNYKEKDGAVVAEIDSKTLSEATKIASIPISLAQSANTPVCTVSDTIPYRYVLLKKTADSDAYLCEVMVYTEELLPDIQVKGLEIQNEYGFRKPYIVKDGETAKAVATVAKNSENADDAILIIAQYNDDNVLKQVKTTKIKASEIELYAEKQYSADVILSGYSGSVKAFLLDASNISPLIDSYEYSTHNFFDDSLFVTDISYDEAKNIEKSDGTYYTGYDINDGTYNIKAIFYDGVTVDGKKTKVFAYMGLPQGASENNPVPAVVCVHGGGGTAYSEWVKKWNDRGYAAIAMDLYEKGPDGEKHNYGADIPTYGGSRAFSADLENASLKYNVMDIIYANNLLRGMKEIDSDKIGIAGVSWGGVAAAITCGVDQRFAFAIANYGCGYLEKSRTSFNAMINNPNASIVWDPINFAANATMPVMYLTGDNDWYFSLDSAAASAKSTPNARLCAIHNMGHSNDPILYNEQTYTFADDCVNGTVSYADIISETADGKDITVSYTAPNGTEVVDAKLYYITTAEIPYNQYSNANYYSWTESVNGCMISEGTVRVKAPDDARLCYVSITDSKGMITSSGLIKIK